jgi:hypothetical protein
MAILAKVDNIPQSGTKNLASVLRLASSVLYKLEMHDVEETGLADNYRKRCKSIKVIGQQMTINIYSFFRPCAVEISQNTDNEWECTVDSLKLLLLRFLAGCKRRYNMTKLTHKTMPFNLALLFIIIHVLALLIKGTISSGSMILAPGILVLVTEYTESKF